MTTPGCQEGTVVYVLTSGILIIFVLKNAKSRDQTVYEYFSGHIRKIICQVLLLINTDRLMNGRKEKEETEKSNKDTESQRLPLLIEPAAKKQDHTVVSD